MTIRERVARRRGRPMARQAGEDRFTLSPRGRRAAGWAAAVALVGGIALGVRIIGGSGDGSPQAGGSSGSPGTGVAPIAFGTTIDAASGLVTSVSRTTRFERGDTFSYSVAGMAPRSPVYVEVERMEGGPRQVVQPSSPQTLGAGAAAVAFTVPADALFDAWGPGEYRMRIAQLQNGEPVAEGTFELVAPGASAAADP